MRTKERICSIVLICVFGFTFIYSGNFPDVPQIMPRIISCVGFLLSVGLLVKTFVYRYAEEDKAKLQLEKRTVILLLAAIAALALYAVLISVIGFYVTSFLFMIALSYIIDRSRAWWQYPVVAVGVLLLVYAMFSWFLKVPLPKGILF